MSCFAGKIKEYPSFSVDCFDKNNLDSDIYFLSHCHQDHMTGMDSSSLYHRLQTSSNIFVYCSETSRNILLCDDKYKHLEKNLVGLPIEQSTMITYNDKISGKRETVSVTLLSAGHCIGSVMFLFEGPAGNVLYTGDFRWSKGDVSRVSFFHSGKSVMDIRSIYVDTTFYLPKMKYIPKRESTKDAVVELVKRWLSKGCNYFVSLLFKGMYGYEYLLKEVAMALKTKIHVSSERFSLYKNLPDMVKYFTTKAENTRVHCCNWEWEHKRSTNSRLPCGFSLPAPQKVNVISIKATSMWFARHSECLPENCVYQVSENFFRVVHSMHASMEEIIDLVSYLRPLNIYPNVKPAGLYTLQQTEASLQQYTRRKSETDIVLSEKKKSERSLDREKVLPFIEQNSTSLSLHSTPSSEVLAECKQLGLEEETFFAKPRRKRRRNQASFENFATDQTTFSETCINVGKIPQ